MTESSEKEEEKQTPTEVQPRSQHILPIKDLVRLIHRGPNLGLYPILSASREAAREILSKYQYAVGIYKTIKKNLHDFDQDKAHDGAELAYRNLETFFLEKVPSYRMGLLCAEEREKLNLLRRVKSALSAKRDLFFLYLETIAQLEQVEERELADQHDPAHVYRKEKKESVYFRKFIVDALDDPLRQALVILKQEEMYLPEAKLVARLSIDLSPPREGGGLARLLLQQKKERQDTFSSVRELFPFDSDENYYFLTGTHCSLGKNIRLRNYLRRDPHSSILINTVHAPRTEQIHEITRDTPLIGNIPYVWPGKEVPALYKALIGREKDKFHALQYRLQQGIMVMRSRDTGKKLSFEVRTQNPRQVDARFFYGATTDRGKIVSYMLERSEEIDREQGVELPELK